MNELWKLFSGIKATLESFCKECCNCGTWSMREDIDPENHGDECPYRRAFNSSEQL